MKIYYLKWQEQWSKRTPHSYKRLYFTEAGARRYLKRIREQKTLYNNSMSVLNIELVELDAKPRKLKV